MPVTKASQIAVQFRLHEPRPPLPACGTYGATKVSPDGDTTTLPSELLELVRSARPAWHADAACHEHPEVNFFPARGEPTGPAKDICAGCLVREQCLEAATGEKFGIWGGTSERERRGLRRQRSLDQAGQTSAGWNPARSA